MCASGWAASPSGASSVRGVKPSSPSCRISPCAIARCAPTSPAMFLGHAWRAQFGAVRRALPSLPHGALPPRLSFGHHSLVTVLTRCGLPLPVYFLGRREAQPLSHREGVSPHDCSWPGDLAPGVHRRRECRGLYPVLWRVPTCGIPAGAGVPGPGDPHRWLRQHGQKYADAVSRGAPGQLLAPRDQQTARQADGHRPPVRKALRSQFHTLVYRARQRRGLRVFALGQRLRHFVEHVTATAGAANGERVRRWFQEKKAGWYAVLADPQMPATSTLLDQAHNAIERKLFAMKGFHHPGGSQQAFLTGLAHLYNLIPYQRRAKQAGQLGVEVEGGAYPQQTGSSICKSSPQEVFDE